MTTVKPVRNDNAIVMAVNADPVASVANVKSAQTCASRLKPPCSTTRQAKHLPRRKKQFQHQQQSPH